MIPPMLRAQLICPRCKSDLEDAEESLICRPCSVAYPVQNGVPVMLPEMSTPIAFGTVPAR